MWETLTQETGQKPGETDRGAERFVFLCVRQVSQVGLEVKNLPASAGDIRDTGSIPGSDDPLEEGMATHSSILAWRSPWTEEPGGPWSMGS